MQQYQYGQQPPASNQNPSYQSPAQPQATAQPQGNWRTNQPLNRTAANYNRPTWNHNGRQSWNQGPSRVGPPRERAYAANVHVEPTVEHPSPSPRYDEPEYSPYVESNERYESNEPYDQHDQPDDEDPGYQAFLDHPAFERGDFPESKDEPCAFAVDVGPVVTTCNGCGATFPSRNRLHTHLSECPRTQEPIPVTPTTNDPTAVRIIESTHKPTGLVGIRSWRCATAKIGINSTSEYHEICLDTGCSSTIGNTEFIEALPSVTITELTDGITVSGIGSRHRSNRSAMLTLWFPGLMNDGGSANAFAKITIRCHLVDGLKPKLLIGTDVICGEGFMLNFERGIATIGSCSRLTFPIIAQAKPRRITRAVVYAKQRSLLPAYSVSKLAVRLKTDLPANRDFIFDPLDGSTLNGATIYAHMVDHEFSFIEVRNETPTPITVTRHARIGTISDADFVTAYQVSEDAIPLAKPLESEPLEFESTKLSHPSSRYREHVERQLERAYQLTAEPESPLTVSPDHDNQTVLPNGITVYGKGPETDRLAEVLMSFNVWGDDGSTARIPEEEWMEVPLKEGWENRLPKPHVYRVSPKDRECIDRTFDPLREAGKLSPATGHTPSAYPVFVVWKTVTDQNGQTKEKGRVVIDLRGVNKEVVPDLYPIPIQEDIINMVRGCRYITVIDACRFFYQWPVKRSHRNRLAVVSHRGQEIFNVAIMGFINSVPYVQRQMDRLLNDLEFARTYVDDIIIASMTFDEHLNHLSTVLQRLQDIGIRLEPTKAFVGFPSVQLLGQRVDALGLSTPEEKLAAIRTLEFPRNLKQLEHYLGLTGCFRHYIDKYAHIIKPLQERKTRMLKGSPLKGPERRAFATGKAINAPTDCETEAFRQLQSAFDSPLFRAHFDPLRRLYADLDASYEGFGVMAYHIQIDDHHTNLSIPPARTVIQPILFLSRTLTSAESRYWPTELEVSCLVWALRKLRHMIESSRQPTVVYTDHASTVGISTQTSMNTVALERLNLRLIRASQYIQQFRLQVFHRPGKSNTVADALSRLTTKQNKNIKYNEPDLDSIDAYFTDHGYTASSIQLSTQLKKRIIEGYCDDPRTTRIIEVLRNNRTSDLPTVLPYRLDDDGLLYMTKHRLIGEGITEEPWIYIPRPLAKDMFRLIHDERNHQGIDKCLASLDGFTLYQGRRMLRQYIEHCPVCLQNKIRHHKPYGSLQPLQVPPAPFEIITMDFIVGLPDDNGYDQLLVVVDKFSKRVGLIPGKSTWTAQEWGSSVLRYFQEHDWGMPRFFISDRDSIFMSKFWKGYFTALKARWLYSAAFHPQTDGQTERVIQVIEVMLRHSYTTAERPDLFRWTMDLPSIISTINGSPNESTKATPHRLLFGIDLRQPWQLLKQFVKQDFSVRLDAEESMKYNSALVIRSMSDCTVAIPYQLSEPIVSSNCRMLDRSAYWNALEDSPTVSNYPLHGRSIRFCPSPTLNLRRPPPIRSTVSYRSLPRSSTPRSTPVRMTYTKSNACWTSVPFSVDANVPLMWNTLCGGRDTDRKTTNGFVKMIFKVLSNSLRHSNVTVLCNASRLVLQQRGRCFSLAPHNVA